MSERISALMDGELEALELRGPLVGDGETLEAWRTYHLIGDALRDTPGLSAAFSARMAARLAGEPTVFAPGARRTTARPYWRAMQAAAAVAAVALVSWSWTELMPQGGVQRGAEIAVAPSKPPADAPAAQVPLPSGAGDYLLAHQRYSPRGNLQGVAPYVRTVSESVRRK